MTTPDDAMLMQYADGTLDKAQRREVEAYLKENPEAARLVERLKRSAMLLKAAFDDPALQQVPERLRAALESSAPRPAMVRTDANVTALRSRRPWSARTALSLAMAASLALIVGAGLGYGLRGFGGNGGEQDLATGVVARGGSIALLLSSRSSGDSIAIGSSGRRIALVGTFRDRHGRPCRELEVVEGSESAPTPVLAAIACIGPNEDWLVEGTVRVAGPAAPNTGFRPSGADEKDALKALLGALGAGPALTAAEELELIRRKWR
jgi:hypothetical protein